MYLKLAVRNAKRSIYDYLLYIFSIVMLTSIICFSNCIANWGNMQAGFRTMALPLLIVLIMIVLINDINHFIIRQRAKEFATYILLGMEKNKLALVFLCELSVTGFLCLILGTILGVGMFSVCRHIFLPQTDSQSLLRIIWKSTLQTLIYFGCVEILSILFMKQKIYRLQIVQLMREKQRNQPLDAGKKSFWGRMLILNFLGFLALLFGIAFLPDKTMPVSVSLISVPTLLCVFSFYKWLYAFIASLRLSQSDALYRGGRLYLIAEMTSGRNTGANLNTVFCTCFLFSAGSFVFGTLLLHPDIAVFEKTVQQWMGFLQINICLVFMILYFSVLSLLQIMDFKRELRNMWLLFCMGKNQSDLKRLLCTQVLIKLLLPVFMAFVMLLTALPFVNEKLNTLLPIHNLLFKSVGGFMACFFVLYLCYFFVVYIVIIREDIVP